MCINNGFEIHFVQAMAQDDAAEAPADPQPADAQVEDQPMDQQ